MGRDLCLDDLSRHQFSADRDRNGGHWCKPERFVGLADILAEHFDNSEMQSFMKK